MPSLRSQQTLLVDTNVLLRIAQFPTQKDDALVAGVGRYRMQGANLCVTFQNIAEFWNVATRPLEHRGFGRSIQEVTIEVDIITSEFALLPETPKTYKQWRTLVADFQITGVLVHDTRLAAIMLELNIRKILTLNPRDFARFPFITPIDPREAN